MGAPQPVDETAEQKSELEAAEQRKMVKMKKYRRTETAIDQ